MTSTAADFIYDIETYRNCFCCAIVRVEDRQRWIFEVSDRIDQSAEFIHFLMWLQSTGSRMVGYNNEGFDWPVCQTLMNIGLGFKAADAYTKAQAIIDGDRFAHIVWPSDRYVTQVDLFKIHHFDNMSKSTSLKKLEINMRAASVIDLPYSPHVALTSEQMDHIVTYMCHDVSETLRFYLHSKDQIRFRDELAAKYPDLGDVVNFNDTKIGKKFFEREIERAAPGSTVEWVNGRKRPRQTHRDSIAIRDIISPKVHFRHPALIRVKEWLEQQTLTRVQIEDALSEKVETRGVFKGLVANLDGFDLVFGAGGIHGSLEAVSVHADADHDLIDYDVASFYPNLAIAGGYYPQHLSQQFCVTYKELFDLRQTYGKKSAENAMLKLALNGVYGDSNSIYGCFFDTQYTMSITINGQLLLCMFAETCLHADGVTIIQANTDGITLKVRKDRREYVERVAIWWQDHTGLVLESADYSEMHIRDVNSYMAVKLDGSVKRIGAYAYVTPLTDPFTRELGWHKDHSMRVVAMAAEAQMVRGIPVAEFIMGHTDPFDFMLSVKVPRSSRLEASGTQVQNTSRYYVSTRGVYLRKIMPGLKGGPERSFDIQKGWTVQLTNDVADFDWSTVNYLYYIEEARKLLI